MRRFNPIPTSYTEEIKLQDRERINQNNNLLRAAIYIFYYMIYEIAFYLLRELFSCLILCNLFYINSGTLHFRVNKHESFLLKHEMLNPNFIRCKVLAAQILLFLNGFEKWKLNCCLNCKEIDRCELQ